MSLLLSLWLCVSATAIAQQAEIPGGIPSKTTKPTTPFGPVPTVSTSGVMTAKEAYDAWLRRFDAKFATLEEQIAKNAKSLDNLEFEALGDSSGRAEAQLQHEVLVAPFFYVEEIRYLLDGLPIASKLDTSGELDRKGSFQIFAGRITEGKHVLSVEMVFRAKQNSQFSGSLRGQRFRSKGTFRFDAKNGVLTQISIKPRDLSTQSPADQSFAQIERRFLLDFLSAEKALGGAETPANTTPTTTPASTPTGTSQPTR